MEENDIFKCHHNITTVIITIILTHGMQALKRALLGCAGNKHEVLQDNHHHHHHRHHYYHHHPHQQQHLI